MSEPIIKLENVYKEYNGNQVVKNLSMTIEEGEFLTMLGPSGCGKTTTLRMLAGFEQPTSGNIYIQDKEIQDTKAYNREINTVFQNYALFPHMTIYENIAFGLTIKKTPKDEIQVRVKEMLELVQMLGYEMRKPDQLSGGQKQRIAIARALINRPRVLLLDEPLGALDLKLRKQMQIELKDLQKKLGITFVYVTHDQEEALTMSDRIAIMSGGILEQLDTPRAVYEIPKTKFVADFVGESNIFYGHVVEKTENDIKVEMENGSVYACSNQVQINDIVDISVRPENLKLSLEPVMGYNIPGVIKEYVYVGNVHKVIVTLANEKEAKINQSPKIPMLSEGTQVYLHWNKEDAVVILSSGNPIFQAIENPDFGVDSQEEE